MTPVPEGSDADFSAAKAEYSCSLPHDVEARRTVLLLGPGAAGKTVVALQILIDAITKGRRGVFLSFDEPPAEIRKTAASFGWDLSGLESQNRLLLHARVRPHLARAGLFAVEAVLSALATQVRRLKVSHIALDGLHVMLSLLDTRVTRMQAALRLRDWIHENALSATFTYAVGSPQKPPMELGPEVTECLADCVIALERGDEDQPLRRLRFLRYRCAGLPTLTYPIEITPEGVEVLEPTAGPIAPDPQFGCSNELDQSRLALSKSLRQLPCFLEAKQAELDLLIEKRSAAAEPVSHDSSR